MVKLTLDVIARGTSGYTKKKRDESINHYLKRLTHLYLEDRAIDDIGDDLALCKNLTVLYLYDNKLSRVPNLSYNANLTHLYLQNNLISQVDNLNGLRKLNKLYLGGNSITVLEGLDKVENLQELHIENQRLPAGEKLLFDPSTIENISSTLQILNIAGNNLESIEELEGLRELTHFTASDNQLWDMKELAHCLGNWRQLTNLDLLGNPFCHKSKYRDRIIIMSPRLEILDGKEITETSKQFLRNWEANKEAQKQKRKIAKLSSQVTEDGDLPPVNGLHPRAAVPGYLMPALPRKQFQEVLARSTSNSSSVGTRQSTLTAPKYRNTMGTFYHSSTMVSSEPLRVHSAILELETTKI